MSPAWSTPKALRARRAESQFFAGKIDDELFKKENPSAPLSTVFFPTLAKKH